MNFIGHTVDLFDTKNLPPNCVSAEIDSKFLNWTYLTHIKSLQSITHMRASHQAIISDTQIIWSRAAQYVAVCKMASDSEKPNFSN